MSVTLMNKTKCSWIQDCLVTAFSLENFGSPSDIWCHQQLPSLPQFSISFIYPSDFPGHFSNVFSTSLPQYTSVWILLFTVSNLYFNSATACCLPTSIHPFCPVFISAYLFLLFLCFSSTEAFSSCINKGYRKVLKFLIILIKYNFQSCSSFKSPWWCSLSLVLKVL